MEGKRKYFLTKIDAEPRHRRDFNSMIPKYGALFLSKNIFFFPPYATLCFVIIDIRRRETGSEEAIPRALKNPEKIPLVFVYPYNSLVGT